VLEIGRQANKEVNNKLRKFQLIWTSIDGSTYKIPISVQKYSIKLENSNEVKGINRRREEE